MFWGKVGNLVFNGFWNFYMKPFSSSLFYIQSMSLCCLPSPHSFSGKFVKTKTWKCEKFVFHQWNGNISFPFFSLLSRLILLNCYGNFEWKCCCLKFFRLCSLVTQQYNGKMIWLSTEDYISLVFKQVSLSILWSFFLFSELYYCVQLLRERKFNEIVVNFTGKILLL